MRVAVGSLSCTVVVRVIPPNEELYEPSYSHVIMCCGNDFKRISFFPRNILERGCKSFIKLSSNDRIDFRAGYSFLYITLRNPLSFQLNLLLSLRKEREDFMRLYSSKSSVFMIW